MKIDEAIKLWEGKKRRMGCGEATHWFCKRVEGFKPLRITRFMSSGNKGNGRWYWHVVATNGKIIIDLSPYADMPRNDNNPKLAENTVLGDMPYGVDLC